MATRQRTKIVCTMGPATEDDDILREMLKAGMSVARLNFSHGNHDYHRRNIERVRRIASELGINVAVMADTRGPEIRTRLNRNHELVELYRGDMVTLTTRDVEGTNEVLSITYEGLPREVKPGDRVFIDDGLIGLVIQSVTDADINCRVVSGGLVDEHKGINVPGVVTSMPRVTKKDRADIRFACEMGVDAIAASFVCDAEAVHEIRELCTQAGEPKTQIIAKVESALAVKNFDEILEASDGIMVARGDLGVEIPPAEVPNTQKNIIESCNIAYKPVITATQMLDSMIHNPRPTRAEVTDVANAIYDGTDCVMLSGETAAGKYPLEAVQMMAEVCVQSEKHLHERHTFHTSEGLNSISAATSFAATETAKRVGADAIICPTYTGRTARQMSAFRPRIPLIATSNSERTIRNTCFYWGVQGVLTEEQSGLTKTCYDALHTVREAGYVNIDDIVVLVAGDPVLSPFSGSSMTSTEANVCMVAQVM